MSKMVMDRQLSACESVIMKVVWNFEGDIPLQELMRILREDYGKEYARTTVATFLTRLAGKGFVETYRKGRGAYTHAVRSQKEYREHLIRQEVEFWFDGSAQELVAGMVSGCKLTQEDKQAIRKMLE